MIGMWILAGFTTADWTADSNQVVASLGNAVSSAGDVNGDGYDDVIVGAYRYSNGQTEEGRAFVYLGSAAGLAAAPVWTGENDQAASWFGSSVSGGGDVNGDGFDEVLVSHDDYYRAGVWTVGQSYLYQGSALGPDTNPGWTAEGDQLYSGYGYSSAFAGDVDGDGFADVIVGSPYYTNLQPSEGRVHAYHGSITGLDVVATWIVESNEIGALFGGEVASAGDVDGDGYDDVIVGAPHYESEFDEINEGRAYVYTGSATGLEPYAAWTTEPNQETAQYGWGVSSAGDVNADGFDDVLVGALYFDNPETDEGRASLFLGSATGLESVAAWTAESNSANAWMGWSLDSAGDVNDDGYDDVVIGCQYCDLGTTNEGGAFVFLGAATGLGTTADHVLDSGQTESAFGCAVASAGDVDGDGYDDILVGAPSYDNGQNDEGRAFLYAGTCADAIDSDGDTIGDLCDVCPGFDDRVDSDVDGLADDCDLCPMVYDPTQLDEDADGIGDACDECAANSPDVDKDGYCAAQDCDDNNPAVYPNAYEACDGLDNACRGYVFPNELDEDGDGERPCAGDCDDADGALNTSAVEVCNGLDDDCDGNLSTDELDVDNDHVTPCEGDCEDFSARRSPDLVDICGDGIDNDCDGEVDQTCGDEDKRGIGCACSAVEGGVGARLLALAALLGVIRRRGA